MSVSERIVAEGSPTGKRGQCGVRCTEGSFSNAAGSPQNRWPIPPLALFLSIDAGSFLQPTSHAVLNRQWDLKTYGRELAIRAATLMMK